MYEIYFDSELIATKSIFLVIVKEYFGFCFHTSYLLHIKLAKPSSLVHYFSRTWPLLYCQKANAKLKTANSVKTAKDSPKSVLTKLSAFGQSFTIYKS